jgi:hypothetical protein
VSKTLDAPYAPGNRGLWRKAKWLNRQEFVIVGLSDPEGSRPDRGALLLGCYTDDGKLIYAGRVGTWDARQGSRGSATATGPGGSQVIASQRAAVTQDPLRIAAHTFPSTLGRAEASRRDHLSDLNG